MYQVSDELMKSVIVCIQNATHSNVSFTQVVRLLKQLSDSKIEEKGDD